MLNRGGPNFVVFLLCGQIPFLWFSRSVSNSANSIMAGRGLIMQTAIPKAFFPLLVVAQDVVKQSLVFICLFGFLAAMGYPPGNHWLALPLLVLVQLLLISGLALFCAAVTPFIPDFKFIIGTGMTMVMFASGIFYDFRTTLLPEHREIFLLNPLATLIEAYRTVLMRGSWPDWLAIGQVAVASLAAIGFMLYVFRRNDPVYARLVVQ